jgi:hypothetical protein
MKEHDVVFVLKNMLTKKEIEKRDFEEAQTLLDKKKKLNPKSRWILLCKVQ